ncbi:DUF1255 family protein [Aeromonas australiensis]|uniref:pyrimidine/purine nucleoside phosphorylase n=1 Tax=Aeromonas australiensis TaxID=1114880 RepID=UPI001F372EEF|nr:pyrimidine/purine nucleoside phosphorylase [Aeromonas australiensis]MCF3099806.1 DUF1255 family protein [Aeromonas australiensis]
MKESRSLLTFDRTLIFFDGCSLIRDFVDEKGNVITFGFMLKGRFAWLAEKKETFFVVNGHAAFIYGDKKVEAFSDSVVVIPSGTEFTVEVTELLDYRCTYD